MPVLKSHWSQMQYTFRSVLHVKLVEQNDSPTRSNFQRLPLVTRKWSALDCPVDVHKYGTMIESKLWKLKFLALYSSVYNRLEVKKLKFSPILFIRYFYPNELSTILGLGSNDQDSEWRQCSLAQHKSELVIKFVFLNYLLKLFSSLLDKATG